MSARTKAILVYRSPIEGKVKRRLASSIGDAAALELYRWMGERQLGVIPSSWSVEVRFTPDGAANLMEDWLGAGPRYVAQGSGDLGLRMWRAAKSTFAMGGCQKIIFLGADCLALDERILIKADRTLDKKDYVVGPAADGGYYLLGMRRCESIVFQGIHWGSSSVLEETIERIQSLGASYECLETLRDVDDGDSLVREKNRLDACIRKELRLD